MAATLTRDQRNTESGHAATPLSAFVGDEGQELVQLHDAIAGYVRAGRWAVMPSEPLGATPTVPAAVGELLARLRSMRLHPVVVATEQPELWTLHGMRATRVADDARIDLPSFTLAGKRMAKVRHAVTSADRSGVRVEAYRPEMAPGVAAVSNAWLGTKRGGELRLTLGCLDLDRLAPTTCRVALDAADRVVGFVTWRSYGDSGRVLDLMRRAPNAPNPTMDALVARSLLAFRDDGIVEASLNAVPLSHGPLGERIYPTASLRSYKEKFAPRWVPQWMVVPSRTRSLPALVAVVRAYSPGGISQVLRRNARVAVVTAATLDPAAAPLATRAIGRRSLAVARRLRAPIVTAGLMAAVVAVAFRHGVFGHELSLDVAVRYGLSGRGLQDGDWRALGTSQLLTRDGFMATSIALSLLVMLGAYEAVAGHLRAALVAIVGAVSGPLLTAAAAGLGSALGNRWAAAALSTLDYGASAITAGAGGALVAVLGHRKLRILAVVWVIGGLVLHHQLADWEHLFSFTVGYGLGLVLGRPRSGFKEVARSRAGRYAAITGAAAYLMAVVLLAPTLVPATATTTLSAAQASAFGVPSGAPVTAARIERITYDSPALGTTRIAYVLLPAGYDETSRSYPVVEMLHGSPGGPLEVLNRLPVADSQLSGAVQPFVAVAPDGNGNGATETDFADAGTRKMGTAVSTDLRSAIDRRFRTDGRWGVMGLSAGGFGATYLAQTHPATYQAACSLSGFFRAADPAFRGVPVTARNQASPTLNARADGRPVLVIAGGDDKDGRAAALAYDASLRSAGQPHRLVLVDGAGHDWGLWSQQLVPCLTWVLRPPTSAAQ